jgi:L,D-transpeptidase ErfK/SrfK
VSLLLALACLLPAARGATLPLPPPDEQIVGRDLHVVVKPDDTLLDIARRYDVGLNEITAANPGVDPWLPPPGHQVLVPGRFVLPDAPREGIVVNLPEMRLYYYPPQRPGQPAQVITHPLSIGAEGKTLPLGITKIVEKMKDPTWYVPESIRQEHIADGRPVTATIPPGPDNPLGQYAMRLGWNAYLIHGTNHPFSIGMRVSHGCLRMYPEDIASLFSDVAVGTPVRVVDQPYKAGWYAGKLYLEAHMPLSDEDNDAPPSDLTGAVTSILAAARQPLDDNAWRRVKRIAGEHRGIPTPVTGSTNRAAAAPAAVPIQRSDATPLPEPRAKGWFVQVGAFVQQATTHRVTRRVAELHMRMTSGAPKDSPLCRILVGPFDSRETAAARRKQLKEATGIEGIVYPTDRYNDFEPCESGEETPPARTVAAHVRVEE